MRSLSSRPYSHPKHARQVLAVQSVVGSVHQECVAVRRSSGGKYTSVTVGPVWVERGDQVLAIYANMRSDARLRYFL
jgi:putative lipoic acid-binding regulatory protein